MLNFKALHISQQAEEREAMKQKRERAAEFDANGNPKFAWFLTGKISLAICC